MGSIGLVSYCIWGCFCYGVGIHLRKRDDFVGGSEFSFLWCIFWPRNLSPHSLALKILLLRGRGDTPCIYSVHCTDRIIRIIRSSNAPCACPQFAIMSAEFVCMGKFSSIMFCTGGASSPKTPAPQSEWKMSLRRQRLCRRLRLRLTIDIPVGLFGFEILGRMRSGSTALRWWTRTHSEMNTWRVP